MQRMMSLALLLAAMTVAGAHADGTRLLRQPTVSDSHVAFAYANDIWIASREGGDARRLTSFPGQEVAPHLSPDGRLVAFTAQYDGNTDVYLLPVEGGEPRRLTWHPWPDVVRGWTADGTGVVFQSPRASAPAAGGNGRFYTVPVEGGFPQALPMPRAHQGQFSPDGRKFAYQPITLVDAGWRGYRGGQVRPVWILDMKTLDVEELPWEGSRDTSPVWLGETVYFLSDRQDLMVNIYAYDTRSHAVVQVTSFDDFDVQWLQSGGGVLVYEQGGYVHTWDPASRRSATLNINVRGDFPWARPHWEDVGADLVNGSLSPSGQRALFEGRGEIFTVPVDKGDWRNLSRSPAVADRDPVWAPDGESIAWFSDAGGEYQLMVQSQHGLSEPRTIAIPAPTFFFSPAWSPDSSSIVFSDTDLNLWYVDVDSGKVTHVDYDTWTEPERTLDPVWSPDSRWIAYAKRLKTHLHAVYLYSLDSGETHQVTDGMADALSPAWDASGKYLYFLAGTDLGLNLGWLDMSSYNHDLTRGVYALMLAADTESPLLPQSDEEEVADDATDDDQESEDEDGDSDADSDGESAEVDAITIDLEGMSRRMVALNVPEENYRQLKAAAEGVLFFRRAGDGGAGDTLVRYSLEDREAADFAGGVIDFAVTADGQKLMYETMEAWHVVDADSPPEPGSGQLDVNGLQMKVEPAGEWRQIFRDAWRFQRDFLYVENFHGADWDKVWEMYEPWVKHVRHRSDLTYLMDMMAGEIGVGHSFTGGGDAPDVSSVSVGLLGADYEIVKDRYRIQRIYTAENWNPDLEAPLSVPGIKVSEGDFILEVNGRQLTGADNIYSLFEATAGRQTTLRIGSGPKDKDALTVKVVPVPNEFDLRRRAWVEDNRRRVDELSGGRLAYVYLPNTAGAGYTYFNRYYFAQQDRDGVVVDERFNGGGSAADYMIDIMKRELHGFFNNPSRERQPDTSPIAGIWGPKVMIINESAGSGGDYLPYMFRKTGIGPLVGTRTWGGLVGIWDTPQLVDGGFITAPRGGFFSTSGQWEVENEGVAPDIHVEQWPKEVAAGGDPQLERAVAEAMRLLEDWESPMIPEPAPPVRVKAPTR